MAKQKKKKRSTTASAELTHGGAVKTQLKAFNWRRALLIIISTAVAFTVFELLISIEALRIGGIPIIYPIYYVIVTVLLLATVFLNSGFSTKPVTADMLRESEDDDAAELQAICDKLNQRKAAAKRLMLILLPFLFSVFFDIIVLFYGDFFLGALELIF